MKSIFLVQPAKQNLTCLPKAKTFKRGTQNIQSSKLGAELACTEHLRDESPEVEAQNVQRSTQNGYLEKLKPYPIPHL